MKREFLQLAFSFVPGKHNIIGWFASEKLNGMRCFWDGGVSRGKFAKEIPWADEERIPIATGLWSRNGKVIVAPNWWVDDLPPYCLDGELWTEGGFQHLMSVVRRFSPTPDWKDVSFKVFDSPMPHNVFREGFRNLTSTNPLNAKGLVNGVFRDVVKALEAETWKGNVSVLKQIQVEESSDVERFLDKVVDKGGEGLVLRDPNWIWLPERSAKCLKMKPWYDAEGEVIGFEEGKGKLEGLVGALIVKSKGKTFRVTGFTEKEREIGRFPTGTIITYRYLELSDDGIPKSAQYWRTPCSI